MKQATDIKDLSLEQLRTWARRNIHSIQLKIMIQRQIDYIVWGHLYE